MFLWGNILGPLKYVESLLSLPNFEELRLDAENIIALFEHEIDPYKGYSFAYAIYYKIKAYLSSDN